MMAKAGKCTIWGVSVVLAVLIVSQAARAGEESLYYSDCVYLPRSVYTSEHIPYFSKHPPVYYSYPVPRPYGYSPYAYPPTTKTPETIKPRPLMVQNRYVPKKTQTAPNEDRLARRPLRIVNPYVIHRTAVAGQSR